MLQIYIDETHMFLLCSNSGTRIGTEAIMTKQYLDVSYEDRDLAKRLGARWDPSVRKWYCTKGSALAKVFAWRAAPKSAAYKSGAQAHVAHNQNFELQLAV